jgi:hypothetical protein
LKSILSFLAFLMLLNSCEAEFKPATFKTTSIDNGFEADITATFDEATGNNDLSENINASITLAIIGTLSASDVKTDLNAVLKDFNSEFVDFKKDFPDDFEPIWELNIETEITYQSKEIITIAISTYEFKGGAHGNDKIEFLNLNGKTGAVLNQNDIIKNINDFKILAETHFVKSLENEDKDLKMEDFFFGKPFQLPENIGFSEDGLVILYNVYEVASYDQGYTEFVIPFEDVDSYLKVY